MQYATAQNVTLTEIITARRHGRQNIVRWTANRAGHSTRSISGLMQERDGDRVRQLVDLAAKALGIDSSPLTAAEAAILLAETDPEVRMMGLRAMAGSLAAAA